MLLMPGCYQCGFPRSKQDDFGAWVREHSGLVNLWALETCFADSGPRANRCTARFQVVLPVGWGALPAPEMLA